MTRESEQERHDREEREGDLTAAIGHLWSVCGELRDELKALREQIATRAAASAPSGVATDVVLEIAEEARDILRAFLLDCGWGELTPEEKKTKGPWVINDREMAALALVVGVEKGGL